MISVAQQETAVNDPFNLGRRDAEGGILCVPDMYFVRRDQMLQYVQGHASVATSLLADQLLSRWTPTVVI